MLTEPQRLNYSDYKTKVFPPRQIETCYEPKQRSGYYTAKLKEERNLTTGETTKTILTCVGQEAESSGVLKTGNDVRDNNAIRK